MLCYFPIAVFSQSLINADFFYFWDRPWYSDESFWRLHVYSLFGQPGLCLIFILSKNKSFESGVLLKMLLTQWFLGFIAVKLSGINFNYTGFILFLLPGITLTKIWLIQKYKQQESWPNKNYPHKFPYVPLNIFNTKYYIKYNSKYTNFCYLFSFLHNFKPETEVIID